jgi:hypothetical protein
MLLVERVGEFFFFPFHFCWFMNSFVHSFALFLSFECLVLNSLEDFGQNGF